MSSKIIPDPVPATLLRQLWSWWMFGGSGSGRHLLMSKVFTDRDGGCVPARVIVDVQEVLPDISPMSREWVGRIFPMSLRSGSGGRREEIPMSSEVVADRTSRAEPAMGLVPSSWGCSAEVVQASRPAVLEVVLNILPPCPGGGSR